MEPHQRAAMWQKKAEEAERLVEDLKDQVSALSTENHRLERINVELRSRIGHSGGDEPCSSEPMRRGDFW